MTMKLDSHKPNLINFHYEDKANTTVNSITVTEPKKPAKQHIVANTYTGRSQKKIPGSTGSKVKKFSIPPGYVIVAVTISL